MLYPNKEKLERELFEQPTKEYRGAPFWAWNCRMDQENITRCVDTLKEMGMGGGHLHVRTGLVNPYLSQEFMDLVRFAKDELKKRDMLTYLYDEDRWPSGAAGGLVTRDHRYRIRFLVFSPRELKGNEDDGPENTSAAKAACSVEREELGRYAIRLVNGYLAGYRRISSGEEELGDGEKLWYAYLEISGDDPWYNNQAYLNTLDKKAVKRFLEVTHEAYCREFSESFGGEIPSIFSDEPQFTRKETLRFPEEEKKIVLPWTDDLEDTFRAAYGCSLMDHIPELVWELPEGQVSVYRYEYHDHVAERFSEAFADTIGAWCAAHNLRLTGHMLSEETLESQTSVLGDAMRSYRSFAIPGIDMLCDRRELSTAKQAQSAVHQYGREGMMSELYGVTNWDFDFRGHKLQGDWQAALGVTLRVPHLFWTSMEGEAKRDYPASIGFQSPWYREYHTLETYFARVNTCMTRGKAVERIGVIHPVESYWLYWGNEAQTGGIRSEMDRQFLSLFDMLLYGLQDFDLVAESLLPQLTAGKQVTKDAFPVGEMEYSVILVPNCLTMRSSTVDLLEAFRKAGGRVIFTGKTPYLESARPSERVRKLVDECEYVPFEQEALLAALEPLRFVDIREESGRRSRNLIAQHRTEGSTDWLFLAHVNKMETPDIPGREKLTVTRSGLYRITEYRAMDGSIVPVSCEYQDGRTKFHAVLYDHDSLLLRLDPAAAGENSAEADAGAGALLPEIAGEGHRLAQGPVSITLEEPNVLLLDQAEYRFDDGPWQYREEVLRVDNLFREKLGLPLRMNAYAQPWVSAGDVQADAPAHTLTLRFLIRSEVTVENAVLAFECADRCRVSLNGNPASSADGWYVDPSIQKVSVGRILEGENILEVTIPFSASANVEAMYLLGNFGVRAEGSEAVLTEPVRELAFGDITAQGLPFYGGNLTYRTEFMLKDRCHVWLHAGKFRSPALAVRVDGEKKGLIAFSPYTADLGALEAGKHTLEITMYGSRINTFGTVHNCNEATTWYGPDSWRTRGDSWSYEYQLKRTGILTSPVLFTEPM